MKITIESTTQRCEVNGVPARIWEGTTDSGIPVTVMVTRIAAPEDADHTQFAKELESHKPPATPNVWPLRMLL